MRRPMPTTIVKRATSNPASLIVPDPSHRAEPARTATRLSREARDKIIDPRFFPPEGDRRDDGARWDSSRRVTKSVTAGGRLANRWVSEAEVGRRRRGLR